MEMKTFIVMGYDRYYPEGGFNDCQGVFINIESAISKVKELCPGSLNPYKYDFIEIYQIENTQFNLIKSWTYGKEDKVHGN